MPYTITIGDDVAEILLQIFTQLPQPHDGTEISNEDKISLALDTLVMSVDSTEPIETSSTDEGSPISAADLKKVMNEITNPDLSTDFKVPEGDAKPREKMFFHIPDLLLRDSSNIILLAAQDSKDVDFVIAVEQVFNSVHESMWKDTGKMKQLVDRTHEFKKSSKSGDPGLTT